MFSLGDWILIVATLIGLAVMAASLIMFGVAVYYEAVSRYRKWRDIEWMYR